MDYKQSQADMRNAYLSGSTGVFVSAVIWIIAGCVGIYQAPKISLAVFFFGGMLIFPLSIVLSKVMGRSGKHSADNALRHLAFEGLAILFIGLLLAFSIAQLKLSFFFPIMLLAIGARYLTFHTIYGLKVYWLLGGSLIFSGLVLTQVTLPYYWGAFIGGFIELIFSFYLLREAVVAKRNSVV